MKIAEGIGRGKYQESSIKNPGSIILTATLSLKTDMIISHIALWCKDLETMKAFYEKYFEGKSGDKYTNKVKRFESYFIEFASGARLELMNKPNTIELPVDTNVQHIGLIHIAFGVGNKQKVDALTRLLRHDGFYIAGEPRVTGDGYYESIILDPEGNIVEITDK